MSEAGPQFNGPSSPTGKYIDSIDPDDPDYRRNLQRPAEVKEDMKQMEGRSRVSVVLNSQAFREELEQLVAEQIRQGGPASLFALQQISDLLLPQARGGFSSFSKASTVIPINDIRGVETLGYSKTEKVLRCKLAACYRLVDLFGWSHGIFNHISARMSQEHEQFLVNPFGMLYSEITASTLVKVDVRGEIIDSGSTGLGINKAGFTLHSAIHQARPDIRCVIHLHTPAAVAVSVSKCGLLPLSQEAMICGKISYHDFRGILVDQDERDILARNLGPFNKVMLLRNHGVVACGESIEEAFHYAFNIMTACEMQVNAMSVGLDNLILADEETQQKTYKIGNQGAGGVDTSGRKWRSGELEWEAYMRTIDNAGYRTGHVYKQPLMKQEKKERSNSDVEVPPASSSFTYVFDGDYEHSKYVSPMKLAAERQKQAYKAGWLSTPNAYKKQEIEEIGTTTPKKITKWVPEGDPNQQRSPAIKLENPNQFAPQGSNPKEFKEKQKRIKKDYYEEKVTPGPQSKILEGISWDDAAKMKEGDQHIIVGAASKGIIQRDHQHNAVVYRQYYAANPFENMSEDEVTAYKQAVERQDRGVEPEDVPGPEGYLISTEERMQQIQRSREDVDKQDTEDKPHETNIDTTTNGEPEPELKREIIQPQTASPTEPQEMAAAVTKDGLSTAPSPQSPLNYDEGLHKLVDTILQAVMASAFTLVSKGQHSLQGNRRVVINSDSEIFSIPLNSFSETLCNPSIFSSQNKLISGTEIIVDSLPIKTLSNSHFEEKKMVSDDVDTFDGNGGQTDPNAASDANQKAKSVTIELHPVKLFQGTPEEGMIKIRFTIHSTVKRIKRKQPKGSLPVDKVNIIQTQPKVVFTKSAETHKSPAQESQNALLEQQDVQFSVNSQTSSRTPPGSPQKTLPDHKSGMKRRAHYNARKLGTSRLKPHRTGRMLKHFHRELPLSPVKEEVDSLEALLAQQNVSLDTDDDLDDLLLKMNNSKEIFMPSYVSMSSSQGKAAHSTNKPAPIALLEAFDEIDYNPGQTKIESQQKNLGPKNPVFVVPKAPVCQPSPKYPDKDAVWLHLSSERSLTDFRTGDLDEQAHAKVNITPNQKPKERNTVSSRLEMHISEIGFADDFVCSRDIESEKCIPIPTSLSSNKFSSDSLAPNYQPEGIEIPQTSREELKPDSFASDNQSEGRVSPLISREELIPDSVVSFKQPEEIVSPKTSREDSVVFDKQPEETVSPETSREELNTDSVASGNQKEEISPLALREDLNEFYPASVTLCNQKEEIANSHTLREELNECFTDSVASRNQKGEIVSSQTLREDLSSVAKVTKNIASQAMLNSIENEDKCAKNMSASWKPLSNVSTRRDVEMQPLTIPHSIIEEGNELLETDCALLEKSPKIKGPPIVRAEQTFHKGIHRMKSMSSMPESSLPGSKKEHLLRRIHSTGTLPPCEDAQSNRNVAIIDAVLHTVTIDPVTALKTAQPITSHFISSQFGDGSTGKTWTLMDSVSKSLENLDMEHLAKEGSLIYGRSLEILIKERPADSLSDKVSSPLYQNKSVESFLNEGEKKSGNVRLYKDDVVVVSKSPQTLSAVPPKTMKDLLILDEGPLQTSSPKFGRRRQTSFKKYQSKMGKSEETLLAVDSIDEHTQASENKSGRQSRPLERRSKSYPRNIASVKSHETLTDRHQEPPLQSKAARLHSFQPRETLIDDSPVAVLHADNSSTKLNMTKSPASKDVQVPTNNKNQQFFVERNNLNKPDKQQRTYISQPLAEPLRQQQIRQAHEEFSAQVASNEEKSLPQRQRKSMYAPIVSTQDAVFTDENLPPRQRRSGRERRRRRHPKSQNVISSRSDAELNDVPVDQDSTLVDMKKEDQNTLAKSLTAVAGVHIKSSIMNKKANETTAFSAPFERERENTQRTRFGKPISEVDASESAGDFQIATFYIESAENTGTPPLISLSDNAFPETHNKFEKSQFLETPEKLLNSKNDLQIELNPQEESRNKFIAAVNTFDTENFLELPEFPEPQEEFLVFADEFPDPPKDLQEDFISDNCSFPPLVLPPTEKKEVMNHDSLTTVDTEKKRLLNDVLLLPDTVDGKPERQHFEPGIPATGVVSSINILDILEYDDGPPHIRKPKSCQELQIPPDQEPLYAKVKPRSERETVQTKEFVKQGTDLSSKKENVSTDGGNLEVHKSSYPKSSGMQDITLVDYGDEPPRLRRSRRQSAQAELNEKADEAKSVTKGRIRGRKKATSVSSDHQDALCLTRDTKNLANQRNSEPVNLRGRQQSEEFDYVGNKKSFPSLPAKLLYSSDIPEVHQSEVRESLYESLGSITKELERKERSLETIALPPKKKRLKGMLACVGGSDTDKSSLALSRGFKEDDDYKSRGSVSKEIMNPTLNSYSNEFKDLSKLTKKSQKPQSTQSLPVLGNKLPRIEIAFDSSFDKDVQSAIASASSDDRNKLVLSSSSPQTPKRSPPCLRINRNVDEPESRARSVSFGDGYSPTMSHPPFEFRKSHESLASENSWRSTGRIRSHSFLSDVSTSSAYSNPLNYEPWRAKAYAHRSTRHKRSHSHSEVNHSSNTGGWRRHHAPLSMDAHRIYQPRLNRSKTSLDGPSRHAAPSDYNYSYDPSLVTDVSYSDVHNHSYATASESLPPQTQSQTTSVRRSESARHPEKNPELIRELESRGVMRSKSDRRPRGEDAGDGDKPGSPAKSDPMDSASGGETLEERSSKEGSPTKEAPSPTKEKKKKKKFRMPSFSKKKKDSKESAI